MSYSEGLPLPSQEGMSLELGSSNDLSVLSCQQINRKYFKKSLNKESNESFDEIIVKLGEMSTEKLEKYLLVLKEKIGESALAFYGRGEKCSLNGDILNAVASFTFAIRENPRVAIFHLKRGKCLLMMGDKHGALKNINQSICLNENFLESHLLRADCLCQIGDFKGAKLEWKKILSLDSYSDKILFHRASFLMQQGKFEEAKKDLEKTLAVDPNNVYALRLRGDCSMEYKNTKEAETYYDRAIDLVTDAVEVWFGKAVCLFESKKLMEAEEILDSIIEVDKNKESIFNAYLFKALIKVERNHPGPLSLVLNKMIKIQPLASKGFIEKALKEFQGKKNEKIVGVFEEQLAEISFSFYCKNFVKSFVRNSFDLIMGKEVY